MPEPKSRLKQSVTQPRGARPLTTSRRAKWGIGVGAFGLLLAAPFVGESFWYGFRDAHQVKSSCAAIKRKHYPFRHWIWSGFLPPEGGFIPDPHFHCSQLVAAPSSVQVLLRDDEASYQIIDVNSFFGDQSQELILIIRSRSQDHEYELRFPELARTRAVSVEPAYPMARMFPYGRQIALLVHFTGVQGYYLVDLPLSNGQKLLHYALDSEIGKDITLNFASTKPTGDLREHFCGPPDKSFIAFYERFQSGCEGQSRQGGNAVMARYREFWAGP